MKLLHIAAQSVAELMAALGYRPAAHAYPARHGVSRPASVPALTASLGERVRSIGIVRDDDGGCGSDLGEGMYQCEVEGEHETCSALKGTITWPRAAVAVAA